jgi:hypothetical protein
MDIISYKLIILRGNYSNKSKVAGFTFSYSVSTHYLKFDYQYRQWLGILDAT